MKQQRKVLCNWQAAAVVALTALPLATGAQAQGKPQLEIVPQIPHWSGVTSVAFSSDGARVLSGSIDNTLKLWDATTGQLMRTFAGHPDRVFSVAFSPDGVRVLSGSGDKAVKLWDAATGQLVGTFAGHSSTVSSVAFSPDGASVLSGSHDKTMKMWDAATGQLVRTFEGHSNSVLSVAFSLDGARVLSGSDDKTMKMWDAATGHRLRTFEGHSHSVLSVAFSPDGASVLSGSRDKTLKLWDAATGQLVRTFEGHSSSVDSVAFSPDGARVLSGSADQTLKLWDAATGQLVRTLTRAGLVQAVAVSPDGTRVLSSGLFDNTHTLKLWDVATGQLVRTFAGHVGLVYSVAFSPNMRRIVSGSGDATIRIWDTASGDELARLIGGRKAEWLSMTPAGFFDASDDGHELLSVVRGLERYSIEQFRDQLQRKDLLHELLSGDVLRKHEDEASKVNLQKILESGAAPVLEILDSEIERAGDTVRLKVRIFNNQGGGIGKRLIWRVNGQTQGQTEPDALRNLASSNGPVVVTEALKLDPTRPNIVSVTAYNGADLFATVPLRYRVDSFGATLVDQPRPRMYILAIGVNGYSEPALTPLKLAVSDARTLARNLKAAAEAGGYEKAEIIELLESDATRDKIAAAFASVAARTERQDTLIMLLAGHGKSVAGRYYYLPFDARFGDGRNLTTEGIAAERWQQWIASVQVDKKLLIIDTCESSDAVVLVRGSKEELSRTTAVDHLRQSVGHSVITAARQVAFEGSSLGHGVLTYVVLEALSQSSPSGGLIDVRWIDDHVVAAVPKLSEQLSGQRQEPFNKIVGNFPVGAGRPEAAPVKPTSAAVQPGRYILWGNAPVLVRSLPAAAADVNMQLEVPIEVQVFEFQGDGWALIGRGGAKLGYVPSNAVQRLRD